MVGELVGARLLSHAGSLVNLAKYPASTVQILGAEKALFRALKTKSDTPKYGLIYHASFVNAASQMNKAKIARTLACKTSLSARVDAFCASSIGGDDESNKGESVNGIDVASLLWTKMQKRIDHVEGKQVAVKSKTLAGTVFKKHEFDDNDASDQYDEGQDFKLGKKRKMEIDEDGNEEDGDGDNDEPKKKKRKIVKDEDGDVDVESDKKEKKKKKKKDKKKKKKKKKVKEEE